MKEEKVVYMREVKKIFEEHKWRKHKKVDEKWGRTECRWTVKHRDRTLKKEESLENGGELKLDDEDEILEDLKTQNFFLKNNLKRWSEGHEN